MASSPTPSIRARSLIAVPPLDLLGRRLLKAVSNSLGLLSIRRGARFSFFFWFVLCLILSQTHWGGFDALKSTSHLIFSNGLLDPWHTSGVMKSISDTLPAIMIPVWAIPPLCDVADDDRRLRTTLICVDPIQLIRSTSSRHAWRRSDISIRG